MLARLSAESNTRPDASTRRALLVAAFIVCWMLAITVRLVYLQISDHDRLVERAQRQQQFALEMGPERGQLLDRHDRELARSIQTASIFVDPAELESPGDIDSIASGVASVLNVDEKSLVSQLAQAKDVGRRFVWLARRLSVDQASKDPSPGVAGRSLPRGAEAFLSERLVGGPCAGLCRN